MMLRHLAVCIVFSTALVACGGSSKSKDDAAPAPDLDGFLLSSAEAFAAKIEWTAGPKTCDSEASQSAAILTLHTAAGLVPTNLQGVKVVPWMKVHGHGTGHWQPKVTARADAKHVFDVTNLCFIMPGPWELNIDATVDGLTGAVEWQVEVP